MKTEDKQFPSTRALMWLTLAAIAVLALALSFVDHAQAAVLH